MGAALERAQLGRRVYRLTVQTRLQGALRLTAAVNLGLTRDEVVDELHWLVLCGEPGDREPLVADVGGYWEGPDLWSEELLPGETLERALRRQERAEGTDRLKLLWPFVSMRALTAYVDVWNRTGRRWEVADLGPANVIVPTHDYQTGARVVALARVAHTGLAAMLSRLHAAFLRPVEEAWPVLRGMADRDTLFSAVLEAVGEEGTAAAAGERPPRGGALRGQDRSPRLPALAPVLRGQALPPLGGADRGSHPLRPGAHAPRAVGDVRPAAPAGEPSRGAGALLPGDRAAAGLPPLAAALEG